MAEPTFETISAQCGIALPPILGRLLHDGKTDYGRDQADWKLNWRDYTLNAQPILSCVYDLEWIGAGKALQIVEKWLNPTFQNGRRFLPFAISGAGDAYCLMPMATGGIGAGLVWHDKGQSAVEMPSFESFIFSKLVESATDLEHLLDDFTPYEARRSVIANIEVIIPYLPWDLSDRLQMLISGDLAGDESDSSLITLEAAETALSPLPSFEKEYFSVVPRWECGRG
ncbi:hypothetical protein [Rhizobium sp. LEGMi135b]